MATSANQYTVTMTAIYFYGDHERKGEDVTEFLDSTPWQVAHTFDEFLEQVHGCGAEYYYVMQNGTWYVGAVYNVSGLVTEGLVPLLDALAQNTIDNLIAEDE